MFVELIESLRCPRPHEESPLVASATRTESRHIMDGVLGCPVCAAEFTIANGIVRFGEPDTFPPNGPPDADVAMRLAAFLELTDARGFALLCGGWGVHAEAIRRLSDTPLLLVNPPLALDAEVAGVLYTREVVPLAPGAARAAALEAGASSALVQSVVRAVRVGGRIMGPVTLSVPSGVTELVRDDRAWVGERTAAPETDPAPRLVPLTRAAR